VWWLPLLALPPSALLCKLDLATPHPKILTTTDTTRARRPAHPPRPAPQVAMPERDKKARKRRQQAPRTVTNVHLPQLFQGAAPETIDS